jgi:hypothetical protein
MVDETQMIKTLTGPMTQNRINKVVKESTADELVKL